MLKQWIAVCLIGSVMLPLAGCKSSPPPAQSSGTSDRYPAPAPAPRRPPAGMSKTKKLVLLTAAAAAAYWYYKHNQKDNSANTGSASSPQGVQYYRSKNGRIYYRDENHQAHWVTPPRQVYVPESEAPRYRQQADDFAYYQ